jgi:uncharacterized protein
MAVDHIRYDILAQEALRGMVRTVLVDAAKNGLPGEHHFYISFDPRHEGVRLSQRMRTQYPEEMTIVLQHQFWDLTVADDRFEVGLSFGGVPERVVVPFDAIKSFVDPSVQFGVRFEQLNAGEAVPETEAAFTTDAPGHAASPERPPAEHQHGRREALVTPTPANPGPIEADEKPASGGEVVQFDRFRKK